jgi:hypothetical protein
LHLLQVSPCNSIRHRPMRHNLTQMKANMQHESVLITYSYITICNDHLWIQCQAQTISQILQTHVEWCRIHINSYITIHLCLYIHLHYPNCTDLLWHPVDILLISCPVSCSPLSPVLDVGIPGGLKGPCGRQAKGGHRRVQSHPPQMRATPWHAANAELQRLMTQLCTQRMSGET